MSRLAQMSILVLRVIIGGIFLDMGLNAFWTPNWSLALLQPYISNSRLFPTLYVSLVGPSLLPYTTEILKILFVVIGVLLILGLFVRIVALLGTVLMLFLYFPALSFPYVDYLGTTHYVVDPYLTYAAASFCLFTLRAGDVFGLGTLFSFSRY